MLGWHVAIAAMSLTAAGARVRAGAGWQHAKQVAVGSYDIYGR